MTAPWQVAFGLQWLVLAVLAILVVGLLQKIDQLKNTLGLSTSPRITRYDNGDRLPTFKATTAEAMDWSSDTDLSLADEGGIVLLATSECQACQILMRQLVELAARIGDLSKLSKKITLLVLGSSVSSTGIDPSTLTHAGVTVLIDTEQVGHSVFGVHSVPIGVALDLEKRVTSQSRNPHVGWLYEELRVPPPAGPVHSGRIPIVSPAQELQANGAKVT